MFEAISHLNLLALLIVNVLAFGLGGVWFAVLFAKPYAAALGREGDPEQKPAPLFIVGPFLCNLVATLTTAVLIGMLQISTIGGALSFGALVGVGYVASTGMNIAINPNFPHPFLYMLINAPYFLLVTLISSVVLVTMG